MTPDQWRKSLARIGIGDLEFAKLLLRDRTTIRRWIHGKRQTPPEVTIIVRLLLQRKINLDDLK